MNRWKLHGRWVALHPHLATFISVRSAECDLLARGVFTEVAVCLFASIRTVCVCVRSFYLRSTLEEVRNVWQQWQWKSPALGYSPVRVCVFIGHGPFECTGVRMGSVCGKYFDHIPKMMINKGTMVDHKNTACSHLLSVSRLWGITHFRSDFKSLLQCYFSFRCLLYHCSCNRVQQWHHNCLSVALQIKPKSKGETGIKGFVWSFFPYSKKVCTGTETQKETK